MHKITIACLLLLLPFTILAKDNDFLPAKLYVRPSLGFTLYATNLSTGQITDDLLPIESSATYFPALAVDYFFNKNWGIEGDLKVYTTVSSDHDNNFLVNISSAYQDRFYIDNNYFVSFADGNKINSLIGLTYRNNYKKFIFFPKALVGINSFNPGSYTTFLKEKNTNNTYQLIFKSKSSEWDNFTMATGVSISYQFFSHFLLNFDLLYAYSNVNNSITKETTNLLTNNTEHTDYKYNKGIHTFNIGASIVISLRNNKKVRSKHADAKQAP